MVHLTKIYTRTGDDGTTALGDFSRVSKNDSRLIAYADTHEANSAIGLAVAELLRGHSPVNEAQDLIDSLYRIQNDLFDVGADLSVPQVENPTGPELRVEAEWVNELEADCDHFSAELAPLRSFILPGGNPAGAQLHFASTIVRRAERAAWQALEEHGDSLDGGVNPLTAKYLNRLSDLLFIMARYANGESGDVLWQPAGGRQEPPTSRKRRR